MSIRAGRYEKDYWKSFHSRLTAGSQAAHLGMFQRAPAAYMRAPELHPGCLSSKACVTVRGVKQPGNKADVAAALAGVARHQSLGASENACLCCCHARWPHYSCISVSCCVGIAANWCSVALYTADGGYLETKKAWVFRNQKKCSMPSKNTRLFFFVLSCCSVCMFLFCFNLRLHA